MLRRAIILSFVVALYLTVNSFNIMMHERAHEQIFAYYGVPEEDIEVKYDRFLFFIVGGETGVNTAPELSESQRNEMMFLHSLNEIVGYHLSTLIFLVFTIGLFIVTIKDESEI